MDGYVAWRGISILTQNLNFVSVGAGYTMQLPIEWITLDVDGTWGWNFSNAQMWDIRGGARWKLWALEIPTMIRVMSIGIGSDSNVWAGLTVGASLPYQWPLFGPANTLATDQQTPTVPENSPKPSLAESTSQGEVDDPLPFSAPADPDAVALIIGVERYSNNIPDVPFAKRDALAVKHYLHGFSGVDEDNILVLTDTAATKGALQVAFSRRLKALVTPGKSKVYVYFAGHGAPDPEMRTALPCA